MTTITRHLAPARRVTMVLALVIAIVAAPAWAILENPGSAAATSTVSTQPVGGTHTGPDCGSTTGARIGAPSEADVSEGHHNHLGTEQRLYGDGLVFVPHVDTSVHQSR